MEIYGVVTQANNRYQANLPRFCNVAVTCPGLLVAGESRSRDSVKRNPTIRRFLISERRQELSTHQNLTQTRQNM